MQTILHATLSASGSPSEVKQRINDQVQAAGASPDQAAALGAARAFIEKSIANVSEDDTLAVSATISVTVMDAPPIVTAKVQALTDANVVAATRLAAMQTEQDATKKLLAEAQAALAVANEPKSPTTVGA